MGFTLKHLLSGEDKGFTTKQILEILGDTINDEIQISGEVYRISSFVSTDSGATGAVSLQWNSAIVAVLVKGAADFPFTSTTETTGLLFSVNGVLYEYGPTRDFHISSGVLHWHGAFQLEPGDHVIIKWLTIN